MKDFWNQRYGEEGWAYGLGPNSFLEENWKELPKNGKILCLSEGEGRNAIFLAHMGFSVTMVDISSVGLMKAKKRAQDENVSLETVEADLAEFDLGVEAWDGIVSIFGHLPSQLRKNVHEKIVKSLKPGGVFLFEAYTPEQLLLKTGGPKDPDMMMSLSIIETELHALSPLIKRSCIRDIQEGKYHQGLSAVVQFIGRK
jgi:2-polyprenyl-3-methyl-5-hydroxy-6-metoxy-1,4-benzoquinol methylase